MDFRLLPILFTAVQMSLFTDAALAQADSAMLQKTQCIQRAEIDSLSAQIKQLAANNARGVAKAQRGDYIRMLQTVTEGAEKDRIASVISDLEKKIARLWDIIEAAKTESDRALRRVAEC